MKAKILLADDDEEVLAALSGALASEGYDVIVAKNGREAIEHFQQGHVDIALLDLNMPVKGGWEAFERLTTIHPLLQVIVITARPDQYPLAVAAGVAALMEKPLDLPLLLQTIDELLFEPVETASVAAHWQTTDYAIPALRPLTRRTAVPMHRDQCCSQRPERNLRALRLGGSAARRTIEVAQALFHRSKRQN